VFATLSAEAEVEFALFAGFSSLFHGWAEGALDLGDSCPWVAWRDPKDPNNPQLCPLL